jgi:hypothetical protein
MVLDTVITIVNYEHHMFIVQAPGLGLFFVSIKDEEEDLMTLVEACSRWITDSLCNSQVRRSLGVTLIQLLCSRTEIS